MIKNNFEIILFDLDGTIIDSFDSIVDSMNYAFKRLGRRLTNKEEMQPFIGPPIVHTLHHHFLMSEEEVERAFEYYNEIYQGQAWKDFQVYEGMEDLIKKLKEMGKGLGLATNKPQHYAEQILEHLSLSDCFDYIGGSNAKKGITTKELVIKDCLKNMNVTDKSKVVMIGDRYYDVEGAALAGIKTLGITHGYGDREELIGAEAYKVFDSPEEILNFLKNELDF